MNSGSGHWTCVCDDLDDMLWFALFPVIHLFEEWAILIAISDSSSHHCYSIENISLVRNTC